MSNEEIKDRIDLTIRTQFPYVRPSAEEVLEHVHYDINEHDTGYLLDYVQTTLDTWRFEHGG